MIRIHQRLVIARAQQPRSPAEEADLALLEAIVAKLEQHQRRLEDLEHPLRGKEPAGE